MGQWNSSILKTASVLAISLFLLSPIWAANPETSSGPAQKVIFDTDFPLPPQDDATALMLALKSPELKILGVTTVAGNDTVQRATSDALRVLEIAGRTDIPVYRGFNRPWLHEKTEFATKVHGKWWSDEAPPVPPGGFAKKKAEAESAVSFLIRAVEENPNEITIIAIGPLTNVATAIRQQAGFAKKVKKIVIMGGAIAALPDGAGNITPNAEFNFWVDPEAARTVLRSGIPVLLSPLNVSMKTLFDRDSFDRLAASSSPIAKLIDAQMRPRYASSADYHPHMYD